MEKLFGVIAVMKNLSLYNWKQNLVMVIQTVLCDLSRQVDLDDFMLVMLLHGSEFFLIYIFLNMQKTHL